MIYIASIPRCGSTYLYRSIAHLPQGDSRPPGDHGIVKTHRPPECDPRVDVGPDDRAVFLFGDVAAAVVSTMENRHDPQHWSNCGVENYDPRADLLASDLLGYERLWDAWRSAGFPVLFVRYERLADPLVRVGLEGWLERPVRWLPWRERRTVVAPSERARAKRTYAALIAKVEAAADVFFVGEPCGSTS